MVLVERHAPRDLLRCRVDLDRPAEPAHRGQHLAGHVADGAVRGQRDPFRRSPAVLDHGLVRPQVQRDDQRAGAVRCGQRRGLPSPGGQPQRRVLELGFGRGEPDRQLAQHLGVRVQRVARRAPILV